ncbi:unnamed protein product [Rotaria sp. Silwood2]|nr:unnamed protein product [Rotaria sp. Silwood2]
MSSYITKTILGNEFDKITKSMKDLTFGESVDGEDKDVGMSGEDQLAEQKRQANIEKERKERQGKVEKEREEIRQKIRDKYNIKKNDEHSSPAHDKTKTMTTTLDENKAEEVHQASSVENQSR